MERPIEAGPRPTALIAPLHERFSSKHVHADRVAERSNKRRRPGRLQPSGDSRQRNALDGFALLHDQTGDLAASINLELEHGPSGVLQARLRRPLRGSSGLVPSFTTSLSPSRRKVSTVPDANFHWPA